MTGTQKVIKYIAITFGIVLVLGIVTVIIQAAAGVAIGADFISGTNIISDDSERISFTKEFELSEVEKLDISNYAGAMVITSDEGSNIRVVCENVHEEYVAEIRNSGTLYMGMNNSSDSWNFLSFIFDFSTVNEKIYVYVPLNAKFDTFAFDSGSGAVTVEGISAENITIESGSGHVTIDNLSTDAFRLSSGSGSISISESNLGIAKLSSGSGSLTITDATALGLTIDSSSGRVSFNGTITGDIRIESESGSVTIDAAANLDDYSVDTDAGSGSIWINGTKRDDYTDKNKNALYSLVIDSGSGRVTVKLED